MANVYQPKLMTKWMRSKLDKIEQEPHESDEIYRERLSYEKSYLWRCELDDMYARTYLKAQADVYAQMWRQKIEDGELQDYPDLQYAYSKLRNKNGNGGNIYSHYWITINVAPTVMLSDLQSKVAKFVRRKMCRVTEWVFEQRGKTESEAGKGMHVHMLVQPAKPISGTHVKRNTYSTFKTLVGNEQCVYVLPCKQQSDIDKRRKYMRGEKDDDDKMVKCSIDKIWREQNFLKDFYTFDNGMVCDNDDISSDTESQCDEVVEFDETVDQKEDYVDVDADGSKTYHRCIRVQKNKILEFEENSDDDVKCHVDLQRSQSVFLEDVSCVQRVSTGEILM